MWPRGSLVAFQVVIFDYAGVRRRFVNPRPSRPTPISVNVAGSGKHQQQY